MHIFLVRHAIAADRARGLDDADRALTVEGRDRFSRGVSGLGAIGVQLDRVFTSPWRRATETAALLAPLSTAEPEETRLLARPPGKRLLRLLEGDRVALVGHEPWMGELAALLLTGDTAWPAMVFKKGGVAWLEGEPAAGGMTLRAFLTPRALRAMAPSLSEPASTGPADAPAEPGNMPD